LRELHAAGRACAADALIYVAAGEITEQARAFAASNAIRLVEGLELVKRVPAPPRAGGGLRA